MNWRVTSIGALAVLPLVTWSVHSVPARLAADVTLPATGGLVVLEPDEWTGETFPLAPYIATTANLAHGDWIVLLYHHDCPKCQEALPAYEELGATAVETGLRTNVLLVEVPPYGESTGTDPWRARLSNEHEWFVQAPVEIRMRDGTVVQASHEVLEMNADQRGSGRSFADQNGGMDTSLQSLVSGGKFSRSKSEQEH